MCPILVNANFSWNTNFKSTVIFGQISIGPTDLFLKLHTKTYLSRPLHEHIISFKTISSPIIRLLQVVEALCQVTHKDIISRPWYESTVTVQSSSPWHHHQVFSHFKMSSKYNSTNSKSSVLVDLNNEQTVSSPVSPTNGHFKTHLPSVTNHKSQIPLCERSLKRHYHILA